MEIEYKEVTDPADGDVDRFAGLLKRIFADENICLAADRIRAFIAASPGLERSFHLLVARSGDEVLGGTLFSELAASGAGFSEYMVLDARLRGHRASRRLFDLRKEVLDREAVARGFPCAMGLFIEVENPDRTPPHIAEAERKTAIDLVDRWRYFDHLGFYRVDFPYVQPPLGKSKVNVSYLDLFFIPWGPGIGENGLLPAEFVLQSIAPVWEAWSLEYTARVLPDLRRSLGGRPVRLLSLKPELERHERRYAP